MVLACKVSFAQNIYQNGLCLLRNDTIYNLNLRSDGKLNFIPWFSDRMLEDFTAITFNKSDSFFYAFNQNNANLVRFRPLGQIENIGRAISEDGELPNEDLISATIFENELFVLAASSNSIYAVNLQKKAPTFRTVIKNIAFGLPNGLSFNPLNNKLFLIDQNGTAIYIDPKNGKLETLAKNGGFANFPRKKQLSYGKIWFTDEKRCFFLVGLEGQLYELDTENRIAYFVDNTGFVSTKGAFFCGAEPLFIEKELLSLKIQPYPHGKESLELEWFEKKTDSSAVNYYTEKFSTRLNKWVEIGFIPGYAATAQSNRYTTLDRSPEKVENCYRLRKAYFDKIVYSKVVCTKDAENNTLIIKLSGIIFENGKVLIHFKNMQGIEVDLKINNNLGGNTLLQKHFKLSDDDQVYQISEKLTGGWNFISIFAGGKTQHLKFFIL